MGRAIPDPILQRIKESVDLVEVLSAYLTLKRQGQNYVGLCPFHAEKTPSFVVSPSRQLFHCFGCGAGGDVIHFLMRHDHLSFQESVAFLARKAGLEHLLERRKGEQGIRRNLLVEVLEVACRFYQEALQGRRPEAQSARAYLARRGIQPESMEAFRMGYAPSQWDALTRFLQQRGVPLEVAAQAGLVVPRTQGKGFYDRFRDRILFPILDLQGRVVGFGGRLLPGAEAAGQGPKYLNTPETPVFQKGKMLYGLHQAREGIREGHPLLLMEGYLDVVMAHQSGFRGAVATLGTALTSDHLSLIRRFTDQFTLTFDGDAAGLKAVLRAWEVSQDAEMGIRVLPLPEGEDPDSYLRSQGPEAFARLLESAPDLVEFLLEMRFQDMGETPQARARVARACVEVLRRVPDPYRRDLYARRVATRLGISEGTLAMQMGVGYTNKKGEKVQTPPVPEDPLNRALRILAGLLIHQPAWRGTVRAFFQRESYPDSPWRAIIEALLDPAVEGLAPEAIWECYRDAPWSSFLTALLLEGGPEEETSFQEICRYLRRFQLQRELERIRVQLGEAERQGNAQVVSQLLQRLQQLLEEKKTGVPVP